MKLEPFSKKQMQLLTWWSEGSIYSGYDAIICDGAVRSGKTFCMGISFVLWAFYRHRDASFAICAKTIRSVRRNVTTPIIPVLKGMGFTVRENISSNYLQISYKGRENTFYLFGGKDESSASLIQGITLSGVMLDEVALMPRSFVEQALARCSKEGSKFWFNCNPEHPAHWFYLEWIKKSREKNALYLQFLMDDNPALSEKVRKRYENLYSGTFYRRFVKGEWTAASGAVYPFMDREDAFCEVPKGEFEDYAVSCDYGTVNPASFGLWGLKSDVWYRIDEYYYNSKKEGMQRTDEEHYEALLGLVGDRTVSRVTVDPSAASFIEVIRRHGRFQVLPAENSVTDGIRRVSAALKEGRVKICENCRDSVREFSLYRWDDREGAEAPIKENDHAMDDIRYFVTTILYGGEDSFFAFAADRRKSCEAIF
ncbi:MAG: PBSX family phage terminase large subunit [Eubacteriales bacterium]|nr:PBSX family phage terminase large subunit [Eubacteriales bacterium]